MRSKLGKPALFLLCLRLACAAPQLIAKKKEKAADPRSNEQSPNDQKHAVQALNRLTFGPRPGDVQQVMAMGVDPWIDLQLHPDKIPDSAVETRLAAFRTLHMSSKEIAEEFPDNQMIKQVMDGKRPMPSDPAKRAVYQVQMARLEQKQAEKLQRKESQQQAVAPVAASTQASDAATNTMPRTSPEEAKSMPMDDAEARRREDRLYADLKIQSLIDLPPDQRYKKVMAMSPDEQLAFADSLRGGKGQDFLEGMNPKEKETLLAMNNPQGLVAEELVQAKLLRAIYSDRQLEEVMTDFWFNHFNVFAGKGPERLFLTNYEQDVIRPHALGKFEDLLVATAKSPAMLFYLDNWLSVGPNSMRALGIPMRPNRYGPYRFPPRRNPNEKRKANSGLNENYGRELLELHTLSVNGGYSQRDVTEVAKVFTASTTEKPNDGGGFKYEPRMHEPGPKFVLGHRIKPKGEDEGREVLHMLATSPQTAHFISLKLAQRFVSDDPPPALVDRMAKTFEKKKGDIREVLSTLFHSPEFWADNTYRAKVKTPLEFVASAVRATGADVEDAMPLANRLSSMGMPLYGAQPPTGYSMKAETWVNSSALLNRMNFAIALTAGRVRGVKVDAVQLAGGSPPPSDAALTLSTMESKLLAADVSKQTHDSIKAQIAPPAKPAAPQPDGKAPQDNVPQSKPAVARPPDASMIAGLLL